MDRYEPLVKPGGLLVVNSTLVRRPAVRDDITAVCVPANDIASELGNVKMANVVMLGVMLAQRPIVSLQAVEKALDEHLEGAKRRFIEPNKQALRRGGTYGRIAQGQADFRTQDSEHPAPVKGRVFLRSG